MAATGKESGLPDVNIPQWKRELILRKRASGRALQFQSSGLSRPSVVLRAGFRGRGQIDASSANLISQNSSFNSPVPASRGSQRKPCANFNEVSISTMRILDECAGDIMVNRNSGVISDVRCDFVCRGSDRKLRNSNGLTTPKLRSVTKRPSMLRSRSVCSGAEVINHSIHNNSVDSNSDSSEEFQYGPGIVSKLKTKYLSMTLRENSKYGVRPSLSNLRRATSLENMLDEEPSTPKTVNNFACFNKYSKNNCSSKTRFKSNSNSMTRNDSMKRAQSMETLVHADKNGTEIYDNNTSPSTEKCLESSVSKEIVSHAKISSVENGAENITPEKTELPPPDVVKQTVRLFEPSSTDKKPGNIKINKAIKSSEAVQSNSNTSPAVVCKQIKKSDKPLTLTKPNLSPKPSPEKIHQNRLHKFSPPSKTTNSNFVTRSNLHTSTLKFIPTCPPVSKPLPKLPVNTPETNDVSPSIKPSESTPIKPIDDDDESSIDESAERLSPDKVVSSDALDNIRKGSTSLSFKFKENDKDCNNSPKTYLPVVPSEQPIKEVPTMIISPQPTSPNITVLPSKIQNEVSPESKVSPVANPPVTHMKQVGVIRPIVSSRQHVNLPNNMQQNHLTSQEKEKNLINEVKSIEQPVSKVVVAYKTLPSRVSNTMPVDISVHPRGCNNVSPTSAENELKTGGLWDIKPWHHQQNTVVFNFSDRKDVPDYIENDGLIMRSNRDRTGLGSGAGETGIIYLGRTRTSEESSTDIENENENELDALSCEDEISRCSVTFIGDNVLINGKSNLKKQAKREKLRIQFKDEPTMYEYVSESSLLEDMSPSPIPMCGQSSHSVPSVLGSVSNLSSYTPSKAQLGNQEFQLGVTRASSNIHSNSNTPTSPSQELTQTAESDYLKPAEDSETLTWSRGQSADLLF